MAVPFISLQDTFPSKYQASTAISNVQIRKCYVQEVDNFPPCCGQKHTIFYNPALLFLPITYASHHCFPYSSLSRVLTSDWLWSLHMRKNSQAAAKTSAERSNSSERIKNKQLLSFSFVFTNTLTDPDRWRDTQMHIHIYSNGNVKKLH